MASFVLLCILGAVGVIAWRFIQQRAENRLRENFPQRRVIEVSLPRGTTDSNKQMMKFYRKVATAAQGDEKARKEGMRQVDVVYLAELKPGHTMAEIRFLIYADEDKMDAVKRGLKQVFDGTADVMELKPDEDPMAQIAAELKPPKVEDPEQPPVPAADPQAEPVPGPQAEPELKAADAGGADELPALTAAEPQEYEAVDFDEGEDFIDSGRPAA